MSAAMSATIIDGKALSATVREKLVARIKASGRPVRLDAVLVGNDRSAAIYAENQAKTCAAIGIDYRLHRLGTARATTTSPDACSFSTTKTMCAR